MYQQMTICRWDLYTGWLTVAGMNLASIALIISLEKFKIYMYSNTINKELDFEELCPFMHSAVQP